MRFRNSTAAAVCVLAAGLALGGCETDSSGGSVAAPAANASLSAPAGSASAAASPPGAQAGAASSPGTQPGAAARRRAPRTAPASPGT
jgi:hypothetical protein